jgi:hypothetical protein
MRKNNQKGVVERTAETGDVDSLQLVLAFHPPSVDIFFDLTTSLEDRLHIQFLYLAQRSECNFREKDKSFATTATMVRFKSKPQRALKQEPPKSGDNQPTILIIQNVSFPSCSSTLSQGTQLVHKATVMFLNLFSLALSLNFSNKRISFNSQCTA